jgi:hypothetical protein
MHASGTSSSLTKTYSTNAVEDKENKMPTNKMLYNSSFEVAVCPRKNIILKILCNALHPLKITNLLPPLYLLLLSSEV